MSGTSVVRSLSDLEQLREGWDAMATSRRTPLLEYDWFASCAEAFHHERELRIVAAERAGALAGVAPLALERVSNGTRLTLLGSSKLFEPSGWLYATPAVVPELMNAVLDFGRPIALQRIEAGSVLSQTIPDLSRGRALTVTRDTAPSMAVCTRGSWQDYYASLSTRITVNLPRLRRRAERTLGALAIVERHPQPSEVDEVLATLIAVEDSGWKGRQGSSLAQRSDLRDFFQRYCRRAASHGRLRVATLSFGVTVAAVELSIEAFERLWQLKIGYHEAAAQYYPGLQLTAASIRAAFERGLEAYEFLGSAEAWEERWRPEARRYQALLVYPFNTAGVVTACRDFAGAMWRRAQTRA